MNTKPIPFKGPMVRALLDGRKTQTRRVLKPQPPDWCYEDQKPGYSILTPKGHIEFRGRYVDSAGVDHGPASKFIKLPYSPGDVLWVRETWRIVGCGRGVPHERARLHRPIQYGADGYALDPTAPDGFPDIKHETRPSIHMPRWASRLTLKVTDVRVQRVQEITPADATAEGIAPTANSLTIDCDTPNPCDEFRELWDSINDGRGYGWDANPWVVALTFETIKANVDDVLRKAA